MARSCFLVALWYVAHVFRDSQRIRRTGHIVTRILITGSEGLIGAALRKRLIEAGHEVVSFDIAARDSKSQLDITDYPSVIQAVEGCSGIVHLAAVSRVVWGERDPVRCNAVNIGGTENVLRAAAGPGSRAPWVLVAGSREVYGQALTQPVKESAEPRPLNVYARSKAVAERMVADSKASGLRAWIIRFSSVYGSVADHPDRVAPAFARLAASGGTLHVDGQHTTLDFTHIDDVAAALEIATDELSAGGEPPPTVHLASGRGVSLEDLAGIAIAAAGCGTIEIGLPRSYDVTSFVGDPTLADQILGWRAKISIEEGMARLVRDFRKTIFSP
jgi:UDP-glucose 4-epimerase